MEVTGQLKRINGDFTPEIDLSGNMVTFGRRINNNVVWENLKISKQHCTFEYSNGSWHLKDTSSNGILIASNPISKNTLIKLNHLDEIDFIPNEAVKYQYFVKQPVSDSLNNSRASPEPLIINDDEDSNESESLLSIGSDHNDGCIIEKEVTKRKQPEVIDSEKVKKVKQEIDFDDEELLDLDDVQSSDDNDENSKLKKEIQKLTMANEVLHSQLKIQKEDHLIEINGIKEELEQSKGEKDCEWKGKMLSILENEFNCTICSELFVEATVLNCGHTFCYFCIHHWIKDKRECPICRARVTSHPRHAVVDNIITNIYSLFPEEVNSKRNQVIKERKEYVEEEKRKAAILQQQEQQQRYTNHDEFPHDFPSSSLNAHISSLSRIQDIQASLESIQSLIRITIHQATTPRVEPEIDLVSPGPATATSGP